MVRVMFAALVIPNFAIQVLLRSSPEWNGKAFALFEAGGVSLEVSGKEVMRHVSVEAEQSGVQAGMTASQAVARCANLRVFRRDELVERKAMEAIFCEVEAVTADYEDTACGVICMDWLMLPGLPKQLPVVGHQLLERLLVLGFEAQLGVAENPDLAVLAAHAAKPVLVLPPGQTEGWKMLETLDIQVLRPSRDVLSVFHLWGVRTLGELIRLPRQEIGTRIGKEGLNLWDAATGRQRRLLQLVQTPRQFRERFELDDPVASLQSLSFLLKRCLETLAARLGASWLLAEEVCVTVQLEGTAVGAEWRVRLAESTLIVDVMFDLVMVRLERESLSAPITVLEVELVPAVKGHLQPSLLQTGFRDSHRFSQTVAELEAMLGGDRVGKVELENSHRVGGVRMTPMGTDETAQSNVEKTRGMRETPTLMAGRTFRPARAARVTVAHGRPSEVESGEIGGRVLRAVGPWLSSGQWWDVSAWGRQEWDVELSDGVLCRLVNEGGEWTVEGVWG